MNSQGFYKLDGILCYGPNFVLNAQYELRKEQKDTYTYPVDGWYWFEDENAARSFFGLPLLVQDEQGHWIEA
jgi:hypothetical protein